MINLFRHDKQKTKEFERLNTLVLRTQKELKDTKQQLTKPVVDASKKG